MSVLKITKENFETEVIENSKTVLLDFWAEWCPPCRMIAPVLDKIGQEHEEIVVGKVNVDEERGLAQEFRVANIPTLVVIKDGVEVNRSVGAISRQEILDLVQLS
ncbi:MAG: thioredoxin [Lachnospiraceae bacterium]|nr:thioredoxin [Lachnospiraceae bacterium]